MEELLELVYLEEITMDDVERIIVNELLPFQCDVRVRSFGHFNLDELSNEECRRCVIIR